MRLAVVLCSSVLGFAAVSPVSAQMADKESCLKSVEIVREAVTARAGGESKGDVRGMLRDALDKDAGDMLADYVWALPEDQLDDRVAEAWKAQCDTL